MRQATIANRNRNFAETIQRTTRALDWTPLKWQVYFSRALGKSGAKRPPAEALDDFRRARFLEPNAYEVPFEEGSAWLASEPALALTAWREALRRAGAQKPEKYRHMLSLAAQYNQTVYRGLEEIGLVHHDLALIYLERASGEQFMAALRRILEHDPNLQNFSSEEKLKFFSLWADRGDLAELAHGVETHPDWMSNAWRAVAKYHASRNDFRSALEIARRFGETPPLPQAAAVPSIDHLRQALHAMPDNYEIGYQLYREQMNQGKIDEALVTVRHFTELPSCPRYFHFLEAEAWAARENWERAWKAWEKFQTDAKP